jgi:hypothetical protein
MTIDLSKKICIDSMKNNLSMMRCNSNPIWCYLDKNKWENFKPVIFLYDYIKYIQIYTNFMLKFLLLW